MTEVSPCDNEFISTVFLVPKKTGDFRPVINLKPLNQFDFTCLPFGYSLAPRVFTKIFKPVIAYFRFLGFRVIIFIDDLILIASSYYECLQQLEVLKQTLCELGFTVNVEKSQLVPVNEILYLGFIINSIAMRLQLPAVKLEKIVSACKALLVKPQPSVRDVAKVAGLLVSALPAVNYLEMHYRSLELCKTQTLSGSLDYDKILSLTSQALSYLQWVIENITQSAMVDFFTFRKLTRTSRVMQL